MPALASAEVRVAYTTHPEASPISRLFSSISETVPKFLELVRHVVSLGELSVFCSYCFGFGSLFTSLSVFAQYTYRTLLFHSIDETRAQKYLFPIQRRKVFLFTLIYQLWSFLRLMFLHVPNFQHYFEKGRKQTSSILLYCGIQFYCNLLFQASFPFSIVDLDQFFFHQSIFFKYPQPKVISWFFFLSNVIKPGLPNILTYCWSLSLSLCPDPLFVNTTQLDSPLCVD